MLSPSRADDNCSTEAACDEHPRTARIALTAALSLTFCIASAEADVRYLPDSMATPGALNPMVTQENIGSTICRRGWTRTVRPPEDFTERLKRAQLHTPASPYFAPGTRLGAWEEDHRVPLSLGGAPYDRRNLWPEPRFGTWNAERKDKLEGVVHDLVCRGRLKLAQGRAAFLGDWTLAYRRYFAQPRGANLTGAGRASARAQDERDFLAPPLPPPVKPPAAAPRCTWVWRPTAFGRGPWFFKTCP